jgi:hypothetical protein
MPVKLVAIICHLVISTTPFGTTTTEQCYRVTGETPTMKQCRDGAADMISKYNVGAYRMRPLPDGSLVRCHTAEGSTS